MMTGQIFFSPILAGHIMNTNIFISPKEYPIMLAIDRYYYIDVHISHCVVARRPLCHKVNLPSWVAWQPFGVYQ